MSRVLTGLDVFGDGGFKRFKGFRVGLLSNQASLDARLAPAKEVIARLLPGKLTALFGAQHGHGGEDQDNMVETAHTCDRVLDIPVFSLYAEHRVPLPEMLDKIDMFILDLQDVGTRVYTFSSTMLNCMRAAAAHGKKVLVLDRPNPLGGETAEGNLLDPGLYSFVGPYRLPMRHGLTMGELAGVFNRVFDLNCDLEIMKVKGWKRRMFWEETGLRWSMPSPNMPLPQTASVYPGQVIWEGTNVSEGRGTCRPFEIFGAPFLDPRSITKALPPRAIAGCHLQEYSFRPTFHKWEGEICRGFMIHVLDQRVFRPYFTSVSLLRSIVEIHRQDFKWKEPPYEYEYEKLPIDLILGSTDLRKALESHSHQPLDELEESWSADLLYYLNWREPFLLYA
jgi:uncharacterized protein YbbC (DUF1343 family)